MSEPVESHKSQAPKSIGCFVVTISDTRTLANDTGGQLIVDLLTATQHRLIDRRIIRDEPSLIRQTLEDAVQNTQIQVVLLTGGTGISPRDQTYETVSALLDKPLPGYGELFRFLSYQEIGPAAILSRAIGGVMQRCVVLTMPGSPAGVRLAMEKIILPELSHLVSQAGSIPGSATGTQEPGT